MIDEVTLSRLKVQFNRLSREQQAEVLGMAEAFTFAQRTEFSAAQPAPGIASLDIQSIVQKIIK
ncbi:MAG: hypothetical protein LBL56_07195, partial [Treponema sp.]|nr:hypothetical protein [Treponema sp.]